MRDQKLTFYIIAIANNYVVVPSLSPLSFDEG